MPCVTDLTHVSTNSLPSTLLKKTNGRKQVPFHDRIVPSLVLKPQQRNDTDDDDGDDDGELSSVSTQSNPLSRSQPSRGHSNRGSTTSTKLISDVSLEGSRNRPIVAADELRNVNSINNHPNQRPRRPSPERTMSYQNTTTRSSPPTTVMASHPKSIANTAVSKSRSVKDRVDKHHQRDDFDDFLNSTHTTVSSPVDFNKSVLQHPSMKRLPLSTHDSKSIDFNNMKLSQNDNTSLQNATDASEVLGRTIPCGGSSVNVLSSKDDDDDDDRHRYVVTITTSRSTIKASGGRNRCPRMDDYVTATSPLRPMKSYSFSNYSTQLEEEDDEEEFDDLHNTPIQQERSDVLHESNNANDHAPSNTDRLMSAKFQKERDNDIISAANSRRSGKLSIIESEPSRDNISASIPPSESYGRNENNANLTSMTTRSVGNHHFSSVSMTSRTSSDNRRNSSSTEPLPVDNSNNSALGRPGQKDSEKFNVPERMSKDAASQSKSLSSTRFLSNKSPNNHVDEDIVEAQREIEILSAAASRKSGKTGATGVRTHRSREVLIEDHEKPTKNETGTTAWKKIDDVLFGDDQSELHLFKTPTKDVTFDDLLTTTSDCSSISVSLDPSGCVVNESNAVSSKRQDQVTNVITDVEFNRVKTVLDRMRKPMMVHTSTNNGGNTFNRGTGGMAAINAPKMKNRIGTGNFVQNRFKNTPQVSIVRAAKQLEESRKSLVLRPKFSETRETYDMPIIVQASSFHGEVTDQNVVESVQVLVSPQQNQTMEGQQNALRLQHSMSTGSSGRKDPPANTLCSEKR